MEHTVENLLNAIIEHLGSRYNTKSIWEIRITKTSGRGIYATRDIECDDVILVDMPIVVVPRFETNRIFCVQCYKEIGSEVLCKNGCTLPICAECESTPEHSDECSVIINWRPKCNKMSRRIVCSLYLVRALLLKYSRLSLLEMMQANRCSIEETEINEFISEFNEFPDDKKLLEFLKHTSAVMNTNSFHVVQNRGLYPLAALLNHTCAPNTRYTFSSDRVMCVRAIRPISKGDEITISYCKILISTPMRQLLLRQTKQFHCICNRCTDRNEFGTKLIALKCINENCTGVLLPNDPLDIMTTWMCTVCAEKHQVKKIFMLEKMMSNYLRSRMDDHHTALKYCREKLASILPPTNQIAIEFKSSLIDKIDESGK